MRILRFTLVLALAYLTVAPIPSNAATDPTLAATIQRMVAALDRNDIPGFLRYCGPDVTVVDEFPPYIWQGPQACRQWLKTFAKVEAALGVTSFKSFRVKTLYSDVNGSRAYSVLAIEFHATVKGKPMAESGDCTLVMRRATAGWRAAALTWASRNPMHPLGAASEASAAANASPSP